MTAPIPLTIRYGDAAAELVRDLLDGPVRIEAGGACFTLHRATMAAVPDLLELSLSFEATRKGAGDNRYRALPVYTSRAFRHGDIFIRGDRHIRTAADLPGRRVGTTAYDGTGCVWICAILAEEFGLTPNQVHWVRGELERPHRGGAEATPPDIAIEPAPEGRSLSELLEAGAIDALIGPQPPSCFIRGAPDVTRLFLDHAAYEDSLFRTKGIYPINHVMGIRRELVDEHPGLPAALYAAFVDARIKALPFFQGGPGYERLARLMGPDVHPYGLAERECATLDYFLGSHFRQGLSKRRVAIEELFA